MTFEQFKAKINRHAVVMRCTEASVNHPSGKCVVGKMTYSVGDETPVTIDRAYRLYSRYFFEVMDSDIPTKEKKAVNAHLKKKFETQTADKAPKIK